MKKNWNFNGKNYEMENGHGYGQYTLNGYHCTASAIWDDVDDEDYPEKQERAMIEAESFLRSKEL